jgi:hypothetical protein
MPVAGALFFAPVPLTLSVICLFSPRKIQSLAIRTARFDVIRNFVQSAGYVLMVRIVGVVSSLMAMLMVWGTFWGGN